MIQLKGHGQTAGQLPIGLVEARTYFEDVPAFLRKIDAVARRVPLDANPATAHMFIVKPFSGQGEYLPKIDDAELPLKRSVRPKGTTGLEASP